MTKNLLSLFLVLALLVAGPAFAGSKAATTCQLKTIVINPSDTQTVDMINLGDGTITTNSTPAAAFSGEDSFVTPVPLRFSNLRANVDAAPGTTGGTDTRIITVSWDPPGVTGLQNSTIVGTTPSTRGSFGCTISGTATSCAGAQGGVLVPRGSTVAIRHSTLGSPSAPDAAAELGLAFCMTPVNVPGL